MCISYNPKFYIYKTKVKNLMNKKTIKQITAPLFYGSSKTPESSTHY